MVREFSWARVSYVDGQTEVAVEVEVEVEVGVEVPRPLSP